MPSKKNKKRGGNLTIPRMPSKKKQKRGGGKRTTSTSDSSPLAEFFAKYSPQFEYDPTDSASREFYRLCDVFGWSNDDSDREQAHRDFKDALVHQFNKIYGTNVDNLGDWQNLCFVVHIVPIPEDLNACREAVKRTFVNLVDLVDANTTKQDVQVFDSELELSEYTRNTGKFFPRENAYAGGLLRYLLRKILHPGPATTITPRRRMKKRR